MSSSLAFKPPPISSITTKLTQKYRFSKRPFTSPSPPTPPPTTTTTTTQSTIKTQIRTVSSAVPSNVLLNNNNGRSTLPHNYRIHPYQQQQHRSITTTNNNNNNNNNNTNTNATTIPEPLPTSGLLFDRDRIQRLWDRFEYEASLAAERDKKQRPEEREQERERNVFDPIQFAETYPHVVDPNVFLSSYSDEDDDANGEGGGEEEEKEHNTDIIFNSSSGIHNEDYELVQRAVQKLDRMLTKVSSTELDSDVVPKVQTLVAEEYRSVVDLWVHLASSSSSSSSSSVPLSYHNDTPNNSNNNNNNNTTAKEGNETQHHKQVLTAIEATEMATSTLTEWEQRHRRESYDRIRDAYSPRIHTILRFCLPPPSTGSYQTVIRSWFRIYNDVVALSDTKLSLDPKEQEQEQQEQQLNHIRNRATNLLSALTERLMSNRAHGIRYSVGIDEEDVPMYDSIEPLRDTYDAVIDMYTRRCRPPLPKDTNTNNGRMMMLMKTLDVAADLLNRMELVYHDAVASSSSSSSSLDVFGTSSGSMDRQLETNLLRSIEPSTVTFNRVLAAYSRIVTGSSGSSSCDSGNEEIRGGGGERKEEEEGRLCSGYYYHLPALRKADAILDRMEKRQRAYASSSSSFFQENGTFRDDIVAEEEEEGREVRGAPDLDSYRVVRDGWNRVLEEEVGVKEEEKVKEEARGRVKDLTERMKEFMDGT